MENAHEMCFQYLYALRPGKELKKTWYLYLLSQSKKQN